MEAITWVIPIAGVAAIAFALYLAWDVLRADTGTPAMQEIAGTILEGAPEPPPRRRRLAAPGRALAGGGLRGVGHRAPEDRGRDRRRVA